MVIGRDRCIRCRSVVGWCFRFKVYGGDVFGVIIPTLSNAGRTNDSYPGHLLPVLLRVGVKHEHWILKRVYERPKGVHQSGFPTYAQNMIDTQN